MTSSKSPSSVSAIRTMIGAGIILFASASLGTAYGGDSSDILRLKSGNGALPGANGLVDPCSQRHIGGPLGY